MPKVICNECKREWSKEELKPHIENVSEKATLGAIIYNVLIAKLNIYVFMMMPKLKAGRISEQLLMM